MKNFIIFTLTTLLFFPGYGFAQSTDSYEFKKDIPYYDPAMRLDDYAQSQCKLDVYYPSGKKDFITIVWFHGGGLTGGGKHIPDELKEQGMAVVPAGYRLSPKATHPSYIEDAAAAVAWVKKNIAGYGGNPDKIIVAGHSAGAYLALMLALDKQWLGKYGIDADDMMMYYPLSGQCCTHYTIREEKKLPKDRWWIDGYAPIFHMRAKTAPIILTTGGRKQEMDYRYDENLILKHCAEKSGNTAVELYELEGFDHGSMVTPGIQLLFNILKRK